MTTTMIVPHAAASGIPLERTGVAAVVIPLSECMTPGRSVNCFPGSSHLPPADPSGRVGPGHRRDDAAPAGRWSPWDTRPAGFFDGPAQANGEVRVSKHDLLIAAGTNWVAVTAVLVGLTPGSPGIGRVSRR